MSPQQILPHLIRHPILGGQPNGPIVGWIAEFLRGRGVEPHLVWNEEGTKALLHARIGPAVDGGVVLSGHMDVVPVAGQPWDTDPFAVVEKDGRLYGRGTCDMKGFLACVLSLFNELCSSPTGRAPSTVAPALRRPIYLAFSYDEEIGCLAGDLMAATIRDHYAETPGGAIIGEPTMLRPVLGQKGIAVYTTTVHGSQGHSSRVRQEVSAVHEAARLVVWLEEKMNALVAAGRTDKRFDPPHTSLHVGVIEGGTAFNIIANRCSFTWDMRVIPADSAPAILAEFEEFCQSRINASTIRAGSRVQREGCKGNGVEHTPHHPPVPPLDTATDAPIARLIARLTGREDFGYVSYAAEAGQFARAGIPAVICGPGDIAQAHRANEFVAVEQLEKCMKLFRRLADELS